jgi:hypothetical protein
MLLAKWLSQVSKLNVVTFSRSLFTVGKGMQEMTSKDIPNTSERFGTSEGESGWKWEKLDGVEAVGMGGKTADLATEIKPEVGKEEKAKYKNPEYFGYNEMSFYDVEKSFEKQRGPQPKSGLTEYW